MRLRAAESSYERKRTATFTSPLQTQLPTSQVLLCLRYPQNRNGISSAKLYLVWTEVLFPFCVSSGRKLKISQPPTITIMAKRFSTSATLPQINQT